MFRLGCLYNLECNGKPITEDNILRIDADENLEPSEIIVEPEVSILCFSKYSDFASSVMENHLKGNVKMAIVCNPDAEYSQSVGIFVNDGGRIAEVADFPGYFKTLDVVDDCESALQEIIDVLETSDPLDSDNNTRAVSATFFSYFEALQCRERLLNHSLSKSEFKKFCQHSSNNIFKISDYYMLNIDLVNKILSLLRDKHIGRDSLAPLYSKVIKRISFCDSYSHGLDSNQMNDVLRRIGNIEDVLISSCVSICSIEHVLDAIFCVNPNANVTIARDIKVNNGELFRTSKVFAYIAYGIDNFIENPIIVDELDDKFNLLVVPRYIMELDFKLIDAYLCASYRCLKKGGIMLAAVPQTFVTTSGAREYRNHVLDNTGLIAVINFGFPSLQYASPPKCSILVFENSDEKRDQVVIGEFDRSPNEMCDDSKRTEYALECLTTGSGPECRLVSKGEMYRTWINEEQWESKSVELGTLYKVESDCGCDAAELFPPGSVGGVPILTKKSMRGAIYGGLSFSDEDEITEMMPVSESFICNRIPEDHFIAILTEGDKVHCMTVDNIFYVEKGIIVVPITDFNADDIVICDSNGCKWKCNHWVDHICCNSIIPAIENAIAAGVCVTSDFISRIPIPFFNEDNREYYRFRSEDTRYPPRDENIRLSKMNVREKIDNYDRGEPINYFKYPGQSMNAHHQTVITYGGFLSEYATLCSKFTGDIDSLKFYWHKHRLTQEGIDSLYKELESRSCNDDKCSDRASHIENNEISSMTIDEDVANDITIFEDLSATLEAKISELLPGRLY